MNKYIVELYDESAEEATVNIKADGMLVDGNSNLILSVKDANGAWEKVAIFTCGNWKNVVKEGVDE